MKKILFILALFSSFAASAQVYIRQNTFYGLRQYRSANDSTFLFPAGNGAPSGIASLRSINIGYPGLYGDTANKQAYIFWGKDSTWSLIGGGILTDTTVSYYIDSITNVAPASPITGRYVLVGTAGSGTFSGKSNNLALWGGASYTYTLPSIAYSVYNYADDYIYRYNGTIWFKATKAEIHQNLDKYGTGLKIGTGDNNNLFLYTNNIIRASFFNNGTYKLNSLTGAANGLVGKSTDGTLQDVQAGLGIGISSSSIRVTPATGGTSTDSLVVYNTAGGVMVVSPVDYAKFILASPASKQHKIADIDTLTAYKVVADTIVQRSGTASAKSYFTDSTWYLNIVNASGSGKNFYIGNVAEAGGYGTGHWDANIAMANGTNFSGYSANFISDLGVQGGIYAYGNHIYGGVANTNIAGSDFVMTGSDAGAGSTFTSLDGGTMLYKAGLSRGPLGVSAQEWYISKGGAANYTLNTSDLAMRLNGKGVLEYNGNPSLYFTDSSLVNKIYVDSVVAAGGGSQDLQGVTDVGNTTTDTIQAAGLNVYDDAEGAYAHAYEYNGIWNLTLPNKGSYNLVSNSNFLSILNANNSADRQYNLPDATGTLALTSDIPASGANTTLSNLGTTAINASLIPDTDNAYDLGSASKQWKDLYLTGSSIYMAGAKILATAGLTLPTGGAVRTSTSAANTALLQAYDVDGTSYTTFATLTANNTPTMDLSTAVTMGGVAIADISSSQAFTNKTYNGNTFTAGTGVLTIAPAKTLTASNTLTLTGTDGSSVAFGTGGTVLYSGGALGTPSSGTLTNATGLPTAGLVNNAVTYAKMQQASAWTLLGNATASTANVAESTFHPAARQTYAGTVAWTGTPPSGSLNQTYSWCQIGNMVTLTITLNYATPGTTNTSVTMTLPSDCPSPSNPTGTGAANTKVFTGFGYIDTNLTGNPPACRVVLAENAGANGWVISIAGASQSALVVQATVVYFTN